ncbi:MAG: hypothetical protein AAFW98_06615, partial [Pseudomonadota bacterium]
MWQRRGGKRGKSAPPVEAKKAKRRRPEPLVTQTAAKRRATAARDAEMPVTAPRSRAARNPLLIALNFAVSIIMVGLIGGIAVLVLGRNAYMAPGPLEGAVQLNIPRGASVQSIASGLEAQGIIS